MRMILATMLCVAYVSLTACGGTTKTMIEYGPIVHDKDGQAYRAVSHAVVHTDMVLCNGSCLHTSK